MRKKGKMHLSLGTQRRRRKLFSSSLENHFLCYIYFTVLENHFEKFSFNFEQGMQPQKRGAKSVSMGSIIFHPFLIVGSNIARFARIDGVIVKVVSKRCGMQQKDCHVTYLVGLHVHEESAFIFTATESNLVFCASLFLECSR